VIGDDFDRPLPELTEWENGRGPWHCTTDHVIKPCQHCQACAADRAFILLHFMFEETGSGRDQATDLYSAQANEAGWRDGYARMRDQLQNALDQRLKQVNGLLKELAQARAQRDAANEVANAKSGPDKWAVQAAVRTLWAALEQTPPPDPDVIDILRANIAQRDERIAELESLVDSGGETP
jgi:hypothetical protein